MDDRSSKLKGLAWVVGACLLGIVFAVGLSPLAHAIPWSWEKKIGGAVNNSPEPTCGYNSQSRKLLRQLVDRIYPIQPDDKSFSIDVHVVKETDINAYAELGGAISVNSGLLKQATSPEELAGVLAHEIGHVQHRHIMEGAIAHLLTAGGISIIFGGDSSAANWANFFLRMDFSRSQEAQADEAGLRRLQGAHVNNQGFRDFFERMESNHAASLFLSDHPSNPSRLEMAEKFDNKDTKPIMTREEWKILKNYCNGP